MLLCARLALASAPPRADEDDPAAPRVAALRLPDLLAELESRSPELRSRHALTRAALERPAQARAFEDPMLMVELWQVPVGFSLAPLMFTLRQPLPWPGKLRARAAALEPEADMARAEADAAARALRLEVSKAYYAYRLATRSAVLARDNRQLLRAIISAVDARYQAGKAELAELLRAQGMLADQDNSLLDLERDRELAVTTINALLARPADARLGEPETAPPDAELPDLPALTAAALERRPELRGVRAALRQAQAKAAQARAERAPDLALWAGYMTMLRGGENTFTLGVQSSIPSFTLARQSAAAREARAGAAAQEAALAQITARVRGEVREAWLRITTARRHIQLHGETLIPLAERAVRAAQASYQAGRVDLVLVLDAARALVEHRLEFERFLADLGIGLAALEAAVGPR